MKTSPALNPLFARYVVNGRAGRTVVKNELSNRDISLTAGEFSIFETGIKAHYLSLKKTPLTDPVKNEQQTKFLRALAKESGITLLEEVEGDPAADLKNALFYTKLAYVYLELIL